MIFIKVLLATRALGLPDLVLRHRCLIRLVRHADLVIFVGGGRLGASLEIILRFFLQAKVLPLERFLRWNFVSLEQHAPITVTSHAFPAHIEVAHFIT